MQSDWKIRKLKAELEEAEQAQKDERDKAAKEKEVKEKEMREKGAKDKGAGGAAGEVEEDDGRRSHSTGESGIIQRKMMRKFRVRKTYFRLGIEERRQHRSGRLNER